MRVNQIKTSLNWSLRSPKVQIWILDSKFGVQDLLTLPTSCSSLPHPMFPLLLHDILGVLKHFLLPKVEEIWRICVEFKCLFAIIPGTGRGKKTHRQGSSHTFLCVEGNTRHNLRRWFKSAVRWSEVLFLPLPPISEHQETPISVIPALPLPIPFALTQTLHYSAPEELNCSEQSPGEQQVSHFNSLLFVQYFGVKKPPPPAQEP